MKPLLFLTICTVAWNYDWMARAVRAPSAESVPRADGRGQSAATAARADRVIWRAENCCGLNSVYFLLRSRGIEVDYLDLQNRLMATALPVSLADVRDVARAHGLDLTLGRCDQRGLADAPKPLVAHFEGVSVQGRATGHFVVVLSTDDQSVSYVDGTTAETRTVPWHEFTRDWSGYLAFEKPAILSGTTLFVSLFGLLAGVVMGNVLGRYLFPRNARPGIWRAAAKIITSCAGAGRARSPADASTVRSAGLLLAIIIAVLVGSSHRALSADNDAARLEEISKAYAKVFQTLTSYRYSYRCAGKSLVDSKTLTELHMVDVPWQGGEVTAMRDRIKTKHVYPDPDAILKQSANPPEKWEMKAFDGSEAWSAQSGTLTTRGVARSGVTKEELNRPYALFGRWPLDECFLTFDLPSLPADHEKRASWMIPELLRTAKLSVAAEEMVEGTKCLVLAGDSERLWLDPNIGYALRRRQQYRDGKLLFEARANEHAEIARGIWIPKHILTVSYAWRPEIPAALVKPVYERDFKITEFEFNVRYPQDVFRIEAKPGQWVSDLTRRPVDANGDPIDVPVPENVRVGVSYIQPADKARLDEVITAAARQQGATARGDSNQSRIRLLFVVFNAIAVVILGIAVAVRYRRRRLAH